MRRRLATTITLFVTLLSALPARADFKVGDLVRSQTVDTVYVISADSKRYTFFSNPIYHTWYDNFSRVKFISEKELASIPFGGVMFVRPGTKMVKIRTDPKVYAVASGGILRPVKDEATATAIWGPTWNKQILDLDVAFFAQYFLGTEIDDVDDYVPVYERHFAGEAENVLLRPTKGATTTAPTMTTNAIPTTIGINDGYYAEVTATGSRAIRNILMASNGTVFARCDQIADCGGVAGPFQTGSTQSADAYVCDLNGTCRRVVVGTTSVIMSAPASGLAVALRTASTSTSIARGAILTLTATASSLSGISRTIVGRDGGAYVSCENKDRCTLTTTPLTDPGTFIYSASTCDIGNRCAFSTPITITVR